MKITQWEAVAEACSEIGIQTSLKFLSRYAGRIYGSAIDINACCKLRKAFCKLARIKAKDCRTYRGQPERNMVFA